MTDDQPEQYVALRDEILELLYWIEGEGFPTAASFEQLARFLAHPADSVRRALDDLVDRGDVTADTATGEYRLSVTGRREGARRFAEEFAPLLNQGHGECNDPDCECHDNPAGAAECHARKGQ